MSDPLSPARGVFWGVLIGMSLWMLAYVIARAVML